MNSKPETTTWLLEKYFEHDALLELGQLFTRLGGLYWINLGSRDERDGARYKQIRSASRFDRDIRDILYSAFNLNP